MDPGQEWLVNHLLLEGMMTSVEIHPVVIRARLDAFKTGFAELPIGRTHFTGIGTHEVRKPGQHLRLIGRYFKLYVALL